MAKETLAVLSCQDFPQSIPSSAEADAALERIRQARLADAELNAPQTEKQEGYLNPSEEVTRG